jgi:GNAT superfamily N-acetyltransferase
VIYLIKLIEELSERMRVECSGGDHDWSYMHLYYYLDNMYVGYVDFQVNEDIKEIFIEMIEVGDDFRRRGIATKMLNKLREDYPDYYVDWGYVLPDGEKLKQVLTYERDNPEYVKLSKEFNTISKELEQLESILNDDDWLESHRDEIDSVGDKWESLYDRKREIADELYDLRPTLTTWR